MSDWDATYDTVGAANNGLDLEMPGPRFMNRQGTLAAIKAGQIKESTIDDKVLRIFRTELRYGFLDRPQFDPADSTYSVADRAVALQGALESITLLKNDGHLLPLDPARIKTIAIIGPNAWPAVTGGGGSSEAQAFEPVSTLTGIANLLGPNVHVLYSRGLPEMDEVFRHTKWEGGIKVATYPSKDFTGTPEVTTPRSIADYKNEWWGPEDKTPRSIRYTSEFKADKAGKYLVLAAASGSDEYTINIDGKPLLRLRLPTSKARRRNRGPSISPPARPSAWSPTTIPDSSASASASASPMSLTWSLKKPKSSLPSPTWSLSPPASAPQPKAKASTAPSLCPGARTH